MTSSKDSLVLLLFYKRTLLFRYPDEESSLPSHIGDARKVVPFLSQRTLDAFVIEPASGLDNAYSRDPSSCSPSLSFSSDTSSETFSHPSSLAASGHSSTATSVAEPVLTPTIQAAPATRPEAPLRAAEKVILNPALARRQRQAGKKREEPVDTMPQPQPPVDNTPEPMVASPTSVGSPTNNSAAAWLASKKRTSLGFPDSSLGYVVSAGFDGKPATDCLSLSLGGEQMLVLPVHMNDGTESDPTKAKDSSSLRLVAAVRSRGREGSIVGFLRCVVRAMEREEEVCGFLSREVAVLVEALQQLNDTKTIMIPPEAGEGMYGYVARTTGSILCQELCAISAAVSASHEEGSLGAVPSVLINRALKVPTRLLYDEKSLTPEERTALLRQRHRQVLASVREGCPGEWHLVVQVSYEELFDRLAPLYDVLMGATGVATLPLTKVAMVTVGGLGSPPHSVHQLRTQLRGCIPTEGATSQILIDSSDMDYFVAQVVELLYTLDCIALLRPEIQLTVASLCPLELVNPDCLQPSKLFSRTLRGCSEICLLGDFCVVCQFLSQSDTHLGRGGGMSMDSTPPPLQYGRLFNLLHQSHGGGHWYDRAEDKGGAVHRVRNLFITVANGGVVSPDDVVHLRRFRATARMYFPSMIQRVAACFRPSANVDYFSSEKCIPYSFALEVVAMGLCMSLWDGAAHPLLILVSHIQALLGALRKALKRLDRIINVLFPRAMEDIDVVLANETARDILRTRGLDPLQVRHAVMMDKHAVIDHLLSTGECGDWRIAIRSRLLVSHNLSELEPFLPGSKVEDAIESIANLQFITAGLGIPYGRLRRYVKCRVFPVVDLYPPPTSIMRQDTEDVGSNSGESDPRGYTLLLIHHAINLFSDAAFVSYHHVTRSWV